MIKLLIWVGLVYMGARYVLKSIFRPPASDKSEVRGERHEKAPSFDMKDVEDAHFKDVMPDGDTDDETTHG